MVVKSGIMERTYNQPLTIGLLQEHVPAVKAGSEAQKQLLDPATVDSLSPEKKRELSQLKARGTKAQRVLILSALPLIKRVAQKELQRRGQWGSRVSYDDILQEGIAGFIRGLMSFNLDIEIKSPTNYLGQWITTSIRRQIEAMDHDFVIPHETVEHNRRMRAVWSRLVADLRREPDDEEFLTALNSVEYSPDSSRWGRGLKGGTKSKRVFTQKHIDEMRAISGKVYRLKSTSAVLDEGEEAEFERSGKTLTATEEAGGEVVEDESLSSSQHLFFQKAFQEMGMGVKQVDVVKRTFGIRPYESPQIVRVISENTGLTQRMVKQVNQAFSQYVALRGGWFHFLLSQLTADEIEDIEFGWVLGVVGDYPQGQRHPVSPPHVLVDKKA